MITSFLASYNMEGRVWYKLHVLVQTSLCPGYIRRLKLAHSVVPSPLSVLSQDLAILCLRHDQGVLQLLVSEGSVRDILVRPSTLLPYVSQNATGTYGTHTLHKDALLQPTSTPQAPPTMWKPHTHLRTLVP